MQGLYQVPVDMASDRFSCPSALYADVLAETNLAFARIYTGGRTDEDLDHIFGRLAELYERMPVLDIKRDNDAVQREQAKRKSVAHLLLGVVEHVVIWTD